MRKIICMLFLAGTIFTSYAQDTFTRRFTKAYLSSDDKSNIRELNITVVYNEGKTNDIVIYGLKEPKRFYKAVKVEEGKTESGIEYQLVKYIDSSDGKEVEFQIFADGLRVFIGDLYVEYFN